MTYRIIRLLIVLFVMLAMAFALFGCVWESQGGQISAANDKTPDPCCFDQIVEAVMLKLFKPVVITAVFDPNLSSPPIDSDYITTPSGSVYLREEMKLDEEIFDPCHLDSLIDAIIDRMWDRDRMTTVVVSPGPNTVQPSIMLGAVKPPSRVAEITASLVILLSMVFIFYALYRVCKSQEN